MLGGSRIVSLSTERRETTLSASVPAGSSQLFFDTGTGLAGGLSAGRLTLTYGTGFFDLAQDPLDVDLSGFDRFLFDVRQLQGEGELIVLVNGHVIGGGSAFIPLTTSGTVVYPFNAVNLQSGDFSDVDNVDFVIRGQTTDFSVAIGGISVVPEPATLLLILLGLGALSVGRERTGRSPENGRSRA